jgi:hypothetical protein
MGGRRLSTNQSHSVKHSNSELAGGEVRRPPSIDDLVSLVRAHDDGIFSHAQARAIDPLTLRCKLLLQLPRVVTADALPGEHAIERETLAVSDLIEESQHPYAPWLKPPERPIALSDLEFVPLDADTAKIYHECFHYVGSYRHGQHFAFRDKHCGRIVCIGSVASFDLEQAKEKVEPYTDLRSVLVFSRFFAFRWAPKNIFTHFWGKLQRQLKNDCGTELMFSFINPNIGFNGCSHKAAQWKDFARETATRYMYLDGRYQTMRFFVNNHGTSDPVELKKKLGDSFEVSAMELDPMWLLAIPLQRRARKAIPAKPYLFERPVLQPAGGRPTSGT